MKTYLVLFKDGTMVPVRQKPKQNFYQKDARFFEYDDEMAIYELNEWYARGNNTKQFKEIK